MTKFTKQMGEWAGNFGKEYTDRNALALDELENLYRDCYGFTRTEMNSKFIGNLTIGELLGRGVAGFKGSHLVAGLPASVQSITR